MQVGGDGYNNVDLVCNPFLDADAVHNPFLDANPVHIGILNVVRVHTAILNTDPVRTAIIDANPIHAQLELVATMPIGGGASSLISIKKTMPVVIHFYIFSVNVQCS
jgi:hypothetical protein